LTIRLTTTAVPDGAVPEKLFEMEGLTPHLWDNGPGDVYGWHAHAYDKVLICVQGSIIFHGRDGDFTLAAGDRLDIDAGTEHAATVGYEGVACMEAAR
jgi:quercetin dioxygenase-like cupin family protein